MSTANLKGKTLFITGASRGIGKAIALRAARDGANIVLFAKTTEPHPKLPGTIYTAAEEIRQAGGAALPCVGDIRYEDQLQAAVDQAIETFGGIEDASWVAPSDLVNAGGRVDVQESRTTLKSPAKTPAKNSYPL